MDVVLDTVRWQIIISTKFDKGKMSSFCQFMVKDAKDSHLFNNHQIKIKKKKHATLLIKQEQIGYRCFSWSE